MQCNGYQYNLESVHDKSQIYLYISIYIYRYIYINCIILHDETHTVSDRNIW